jgi:hypothetical protein
MLKGVEACLKNGRLVDPESYELYSTSGSKSGQIFRKARINTENMVVTNMFLFLKFYYFFLVTRFVCWMQHIFW